MVLHFYRLSCVFVKMANFHNFKANFLIFYSFCVINLVFCFQCPSDGQTGTKLPDVTSFLPSQTGYEAWAEIVVDGQLSQRIYEEFDNDLAEGHVQSKRVTNDFESEFHHYYQTNECFLISSSQHCRSTTIDEQAKIGAISELYGIEVQYGIASVFGKQIGPVGIITGLMNSDKGRYYPASEGGDLKKWIFCEKDEYYIEIYVQVKSNYPAYIRVTHPTKDTIMTINFVSFMPKTTKQLVTSVPLGFGCSRVTTQKLPDFPQFAGYSPTFLKPDFQFYAELVSAYTSRTDDDKKFATTDYARISFAENTLVLERIESGGDNYKFISNLDTNVAYYIDKDKSECKMLKIQRNLPPIMLFGIIWPDDESFNLLHAHLWVPNDYCKPIYLGQIISGGKTMDVYECIIDDFFNGRLKEHVKAVVTYYFPTGNDANRSPSKIVIKGYQNTAFQNIRIDLNIIEYSEHPVDNIESFDLSQCFPDNSRYIWFQISFPDTLSQVLSFVGRTLQVEDSFREQLHSWLQIPRIRVPDIRISFMGPTMYISVKLLERLDYGLTQETHPNSIVAEPTKIFYLNSLQECGQICDESEESKCSFSYCSDMRCFIYDSKEDYTIQTNSTTDDCQTYAYDPENSSARKFHFMPSRKVVKHINEHVKKLFVEVGKKRIFADDVYLISGPDDIGRSDIDDNLDIAGALENEYKLVQSNRKIFNIDARRPVGLSYIQCLQECENNDDCHSLSYCSADNNHDNECLISQLYGSQLNDKETRANEKCNIYTKNYLASYAKIPGKALVFDAIEIKSEIPPEECAKECTTRDDIECLSFDLCSDVSRTWSGKTVIENTCFLHSYHIARDRKHEIDTKVWDLSKARCTHYSRQLSQEFEQYFLQKLSDDDLSIELADKSMENCASLCLSQKCKSYEFCQDRNPNSQEYETTCRISRVKAEEGVSMVRSVKKDCSVYVIKERVQQTETRINDNRSLAFGLSGFFFVAALIFGAGSAYYVIWRRERND